MSQVLPIHYRSKLSQNDYSTSSGIGLNYRPKISENYERLQRPIPNFLKLSDPLTQNEGYLTCQEKYYDAKFKFEVEEPMRKAPSCKAQYQKTLEEKMLKKYPRELTIGKGNTEYRRSFDGKPEKLLTEIIFCPADTYPCESRGLGRDEQSPVPPGVPSVMRLVDPYLSETQLQFAHYSPKQQLDYVGGKNIITFYDTNPEAFPIVFGHGPKEKIFIGSPLSQRSLHIYDKTMFNFPVLNRIQRTYTRIVPRRGMETEFQAKYISPTNDLIAKTRDIQSFPPIPKASPWENLSPPNMYCTESCHVGSHWPLLATVNQGKALQIKS